VLVNCTFLNLSRTNKDRDLREAVAKDLFENNVAVFSRQKPKLCSLGQMGSPLGGNFKGAGNSGQWSACNRGISCIHGN
jgi:hypothetical protein